jgi:hypothetical protein
MYIYMARPQCDTPLLFGLRNRTNGQLGILNNDPKIIIIIWENHGLRNITNGQLGILNNDPKIIIIIWENHGLRNTKNGHLGINNDPKI